MCKRRQNQLFNHYHSGSSNSSDKGWISLKRFHYVWSDTNTDTVPHIIFFLSRLRCQLQQIHHALLPHHRLGESLLAVAVKLKDTCCLAVKEIKCWYHLIVEKFWCCLGQGYFIYPVSIRYNAQPYMAQTNWRTHTSCVSEMQFFLTTVCSAQSLLGNVAFH